VTQVAPLPPRRSRREDEQGPGRSQRPQARPPADIRSGGEGLRGRHATTTGQGFDRLIGWTLVGSLIPGLGLVVAGRRAAGRFLLALAGLAVAAGAALVLFGDPVAFGSRILTSPNKLFLVAAGCGVLALLWALLVLVTHASLRPYANLTAGQRRVSMALVAALVIGGIVPAITAGRYALVTRDTIEKVFETGGTKISANSRRAQVTAADPWADVPRVNVLLIGSDAGKGRDGIRPDTLILASIDTKSGNTVLVSLPRNLQKVPFPQGSRAAAQYPNGFQCINPENGVNTECLLNAIWSFAESHPDYYPGVKNKGLTATAQAVEQVLGLGVDYYAMVNLDGFRQFVNAIGGVRINVKERLPIGGDSTNHVATGGWIEPGNQRLWGFKALWYARSRWSTSDYDRMERQRCLIAAVREQADPQKLALNFEKIARAAADNIRTDIPRDELDAWVTLTLRVKQAKVRSLAFTDKLIKTWDPDFDKMRSLVKQAVKASEATPKPSTSAAAGGGTAGSSGNASSGDASSGGSSGGSSSGGSSSGGSSPRTAAEDVDKVC
jgi:LCP family protein required for cell wall assembly